MGHTIEYRGIRIFCENYIYWIALNPTARYLTFDDCKKEIDRITSQVQTTYIKRHLN